MIVVNKMDLVNHDAEAISPLLNVISSLCTQESLDYFTVSAIDFDSVEPAFTKLFEKARRDSGTETSGRKTRADSWTRRRQSTPHHQLADSLADFQAVTEIKRAKSARRGSWGLSKIFSKKI